MHDNAARSGAAMVIQRGKLVIAGVCIPADELTRRGLANEFFSRKPVNLLHVGIHFCPQGYKFAGGEDDFFPGRRENSRTASSASDEFASAPRQKRRRRFAWHT